MSSEVGAESQREPRGRFDREKAKYLLLGWGDEGTHHYVDGMVDELEECIEPDGWNAILRMLGTYYPESIFPQQPTDADWGNGPQVISLVRLLRSAEERLERIAALGNDYSPYSQQVQAILGPYAAAD